MELTEKKKIISLIRILNICIEQFKLDKKIQLPDEGELKFNNTIYLH
jgi:hypothetical protein|tara:strand:- start:336 stop:476 length:141 start_codon:yes stop_codon:yes gene_type:complete